MNIRKLPPSGILSSLIKEFLIIESDEGMNNTILPDASMVMAFPYRGHVLQQEGKISEIIPAGAVSGLRRSARALQYVKSTSNLLVILHEGALRAFSKIPAHDLFARSIGGEHLFGVANMNEILERLYEAKTDRARVDAIENFLLRMLLQPKPDLLIAGAVQLIKQHKGNVRIKELAASLHISQDPFEKRFRSLIGASPKQYASIIRLKNLISNYSSYPSLTEASYEAGYYDQSHFIKDFRLFTGQAPKDFFQSSRYW